MQTQRLYTFSTPFGKISTNLPIQVEDVLATARVNEAGEVEALTVVATSEHVTVRIPLDHGQLFDLHFQLDWWAKAWNLAKIPALKFAGGPALVMYEKLGAFWLRQPRKRGDRGVGKSNRALKDFYIAEVLRRMRDDSEISERTAVVGVCEDALDEGWPWPWSDSRAGQARLNTLRTELRRWRKGKSRKS